MQYCAKKYTNLKDKILRNQGNSVCIVQELHIFLSKHFGN